MLYNQTKFRSTKHRWMVVIALATVATILLSSLGIPVSLVSAQAQQPQWRVDAQGNITKDGVIFRVKGASWFGLEGRHEPSNDPDNPSGAPMEQYMGNVFWAPSSRTYDQDIAEFKAMGINLIRLPLVPQTLRNNPPDPQGMEPYLKNHDSVVIPNARLALETIIKKLDAAGIMVLLDVHSCSNYVGWRKGRFDARPPWSDADRDNYDFKRENYSCASTLNPPSVQFMHPYNETMWRADLRTLAGLGTQLGVTNIMGIDIFNEPHDYTWAEWRRLIDVAYGEINAVNSNILIFAQGIGTVANTQDGSPTTTTQVPHGAVETNANWGENLFEAGANPPTMPKNRLVYSPHTYGPSVFVQKMFMDPTQPECAGLEGDAAGDHPANCRIVINPTLLRQGWQEHFGYLKAQGYAIVIGEFGGNLDWPRGKASLRDQNRWNHITDNTIDMQWQNAFVDYLISVGITDSIYWSVNPESGDTGGIYTTPYQPGSNESGWGTWGPLDQRKVTLLNRLWNAGPQQPTPTFTPTGVTNTPTFTPTATQPGSNNTGWVSPSNQASQSGGDGNGFQSSPTNAFADGGGVATDTDSGNGTSTSCTSTNKDRHAYFSYPLSIPAGSTITGIEVRTDARADSTSGTPRFCLQLSWNNGTSWTTMKTGPNLSTAERTDILGSSSDTWGRTWNTNELTSANFRVRIVSVASSTSRDFFLDWVPVRVSYTGGGVTNTPTFTPTGVTNTPTRTPTPTNTSVTNTPTRTPTITPTSGSTSLKLQYRAADTNAGDNQIKPHFNIINLGGTAVPLSELKIRYWYTREGTQAQNFWCDYSAVTGSCSNVTGTFVQLNPARSGADFYLEVGFTAGAGSIAAGGQSGEIQTRFAKTDWSNYNETGDYSFDPTKLSFADWTRVTLYRNGVLVWGVEP
jgi:hypothetical protein